MNIHTKPTYQDLTASLHIACMLGDESRVKHLLSIGAHRNAENDSGTSALGLADFLHRVEIVKILLHDINIKEAGGYELLKAIRMDRATVVRALLEMGVKEELVEDDGFFRSALVLACCVSDTRVLGALVKYGPGVEVFAIKDVLIQCAVAAENLEVVDGIHDLVRNERGTQTESSIVCLPYHWSGVCANMIGIYVRSLFKPVCVRE